MAYFHIYWKSENLLARNREYLIIRILIHLLLDAKKLMEIMFQCPLAVFSVKNNLYGQVWYQLKEFCRA